MTYVQRDANGVIVGAFALPQPGYATEALADTAAEVTAFRQRVADAISAAANPPEKTALAQQAASALAANDAYLALALPSAADNTAQVKRLTQQMSLVLKRLVQVA